MAQNEEYYNFGKDILSEVNVKLRDIEDKQNMLKDRVLLIGQNLISQKNETEQEVLETKATLLELEGEIKRIKTILQGIVENSDNFTRKNEFEILKRQFQMFQPLELARISDVERIVDKKIKALKQHN